MNYSDLPSERPLVTWYGDDFTGSAAVLEVLATVGLPAVLFMDIPTREQLAPYASWPGIGIAGAARRHDPQWMEENLPAVFDFLSGLSAPIAHYKVCSTFDSSPKVGSIGKAIELGLPILGGEWTPLLVAAPPIGRYQFFGNLFAVADGEIFRLDRHPTMSRHPVTPMTEADVRLHLAEQTSVPVGLVDVASLQAGLGADALQEEVDTGNTLVALDAFDDATLAKVGRLIWDNRGERLFAVGSQGVEYALTHYWMQSGLLKPQPSETLLGPAGRFAAVSASLSPITAAQLEWARDNDFELIRLNAEAAADLSEWDLEVDRASEKALRSAKRDRTPIIYTALGPDDPSVSRLMAAIRTSEATIDKALERIGEGLGTILNRLIRTVGITRAAVAGGDTSSLVVHAMGVRSLTFKAKFDHAVSVMHAEIDERNDAPLEISLKGGQMGPVNYFGIVRNGFMPTSKEMKR